MFRSKPNGPGIGHHFQFRTEHSKWLLNLLRSEVKMSSNGVLVTPVELNRSLLNSLFKFKPESKLYPFIAKKTNQDKSIYTLAEV